MSEETLLLTPEEIQKLSRILADTLIQTQTQQITEITYVSQLQIEIRDQAKILVGVLFQAHLQYTATTTPQGELQIQAQITEVINLDLMASSVHGITDILGQIAGWFRSIIDTVASWIVSSIQSFIKGIVDTISSIINSIASAISGFISTAVKTIADFITGAIKTIVGAITDFIKGAVSTIQSVISGIVSTIQSIISTVGSAITGALQTIGSSIMGAIKAVSSAISTVISTLTSTITSAISTISGVISGIASTIMNAISGVINTISSVISGIASAIINAISGVVKTLSDVFSAIGKAIIDTISAIIKAIADTIGAIGKTILDALSGFAKAITDVFSTIGKAIIDAVSGVVKAISDALGAIGKAIVDAVGGFFKAVGDVLSAIGKTILDALSTVAKTLSDVFGAIAKGIMDGITSIGKGIMDLWNFLVSAFQDIASKVGAGFQVIGNTLMGFVNSILKVGEWIWNAIQGIGKAIWDALSGFGKWLWDGLQAIGKTITDALSAAGKAIMDFFGAIVDGIKAFIADPLGWINKNIVQPIMGALEWLWNALQGVWNWIVNAIGTVVNWIWQGISNLGKAFVNLVVAGVRGIVDFAGKVLSGVQQYFIEPIMGMFKAVFEGIGEFVKGMVQRITTGKSQGEMAEALALFGVIVSTQFTFRMLSQALMWIGELTSDWKLMPNVAIKIFGAGGETTIEIPLKVGNVLKHLASEFRQYPDELMRGFFYGIAIWITQPIVRSINSMFRNTLPIELPPVATIVETSRRALPHEKFGEVLDKAKYFMSLYGYSDYVIDLYFKPAKEYNITVTDRFGTKRLIPLSLIYQLPSSSDVATMMVRDIFPTIEEFQKIYLATGMEKDIGALYYFLRFRYPPPERLWQFTVRGISGLLWATLPDTEKADIQKEASAIGAPTPVAPIDINFKADQLLSAFKTYMKWHDYARFSWIKDFPSDNLIYIDTLADIPTKIDQRWMVKWGLYELLSAKKVTIESPVKDFSTKIIEGTATSKVQMDLTNFSRTILATGLHPDWVPATAVAEAMNALAEERTAIRSGFMSLFKEGFYDVTALEKLLSGFITASFQVAYFDMSKMEWTTGWVNLPVMYLPPERKLLELKALTDRSLDILREIQRDISVAYQEYIILNYTEYKAKLTEVINNINKFYASDYETITGTKLPDELKLKFVEEYYKPYIEALKIWRDVFTIRRVRMWTQRWLGWVMYRIAYGTARKEDVEKLVTYVSDKAKLTDYETEFIRDVMDIMYGIARQSTASEYLPTPSTMATLSEYITLPTDLVKTVLAERGIPDVWMNIWLRYIAVRPIKADAKALLSTYVKAFRYGAITKKVLDDYISTLPQYGFTQKEIEFITQSVQLEEQILEFKASMQEYIPTPSTLATLSEYVVISQEIINKALEARKVPEDWAKIWKQYIDVRPIADDVRGLITSYRRALLYVTIPKEQETKVIEYAKLIGFTQREFDILALRVQLEELILEARENRSEYIPTPSMLATISEYVPEAREFFQQVMQARRVPADWQKIWAKYIDIRPLVDDIKRYLSRAETLYVRFMTKKEDFQKILDEVADYLGYTQKELEFLMKVTEFERYRNAWTELIGSVERLVDLSEYSPKASEYALGKLSEMIDALPLPPADKQKLKEMWEEYIRNRPVKAEAKTYITQLINLYVDGLMDGATFKKELWEMKKWGFSDNELMFYEAQAGLRKARKLRIPIAE